MGRIFRAWGGEQRPLPSPQGSRPSPAPCASTPQPRAPGRLPGLRPRRDRTHAPHTREPQRSA
jgi:hypothetical protein